MTGIMALMDVKFKIFKYKRLERKYKFSEVTSSPCTFKLEFRSFSYQGVSFVGVILQIDMLILIKSI